MSDSPTWDLGRYRPLIKLLARGLLRDWPQLRPRVDQSDLTQTVLLKAHQGLAKFRGRTEEELLTWLTAILKNEFREVCRHEFAGKRDPALEQSIDQTLTRSSVRLGAFLEASQSSPSEAAQHREAMRDVAAALETLTAQEYEMLVAHDIEGESFREIGERLGLAPATVLRRVTEAREKLLARLTGHDSRERQ